MAVNPLTTATMTFSGPTIPLVRIPDLHPAYRDVDLVVESCLAKKRTAEGHHPAQGDGVLGSVIVKRADGSHASSPLLPIRGDRDVWETLRRAYLGNGRVRATPGSAA